MIPLVIFKILTTNTDITDIIEHRVYPEQAPQNVRMPFIVYQIDNVIPEPNKDEVSNLDTYSITLVLFGNDYDQLFTLGAHCRTSLDRFKGVIAHTDIDSINYKTTKGGYDNQANVYVLESDYTIREKR
jgi:hypothetical protein